MGRWGILKFTAVPPISQGRNQTMILEQQILIFYQSSQYQDYSRKIDFTGKKMKILIPSNNYTEKHFGHLIILLQ